MSEDQRYPLNWPAGWRRTAHRTRASFGKKMQGEHYASKKPLSVYDGNQRILTQLGLMRVKSVVVSTNLVLRLDGEPRSDQKAPTDPGVAVYWKTRNNEARCMAIDSYDRVADNLAAVAATLQAMRAIDRYGGASIMDRAFSGFKALSAPKQWWSILGVSQNASLVEIQDAYREAASRWHPDKPGGDASRMAEINWAREAGMAGL